ncbi:hypothetical protein PAYE108092_20965 [Paracoccus yeei]
MSNLYWLTDAQMERLKPFFGHVRQAGVNSRIA